jgi:hypothetical protein
VLGPPHRAARRQAGDPGTVSTGLDFRHTDGRLYGTTPPVSVDDDVRHALRTLGFTPGEARAAVDAARSHVGADAGVESLLREALRSLRTEPVARRG